MPWQLFLLRQSFLSQLFETQTSVLMNSFDECSNFRTENHTVSVHLFIHNSHLFYTYVYMFLDIEHNILYDGKKIMIAISG